MWQYSLCHDVLGAFIEVVAGKRLRDYAREVLARIIPRRPEELC